MRPLRHFCAALLAIVIAACGGGGGSGNQSELAVRVLHASPDSPLVNVLLDNQIIAASMDYRQGTSFLQLTARNYDIAVDALLPSGAVRVVDLVDQPLAALKEYTVIALGLAVDDSVEGLLIENPLEDIAAGNFRLQVVHGVPNGPTIDVYATAPGADLAAEAPIANLNFRGYTGLLTFPAGEYQIRITPAGDKGTLLFDSGPAEFDSNSDLLLVAVPNAGTGTAPIGVLVNDGVRTTQLFDVTTQAEVRVLQLSPDAPPLQVTADPTNDDPVVSLTAAFPTGLPFPENTDYQVLTAGEYQFTVADAANPTTALVQRTQILFQNQRVTLAVVGLLASLSPVVLFDDVRPVASEGRLRILHGAPAKSAVDVYVTTPGTDLASATPILRSLSLGSASSYLNLAPGDYQVTFTEPGTQTVLATATTPLGEASAFTVIITDIAGGGTPLGIIVENDLP